MAAGPSQRARPPEAVDSRTPPAAPRIGGEHSADTLVGPSAAVGPARGAGMVERGADTLAPARVEHDADTLAPARVEHDADTLAPARVEHGAAARTPGHPVAGDAPTIAGLEIGGEARTLAVDGAPRPAAARGRGEEPVIGEVIGRYVVLTRLGAGGMGVVYAAYDPELDRKVALKLLRDPRGGAEARVRLVREAQAMAQLAHPNVVAVHDVGTVDDRVYVAMEFVAGETLTSWLGRSRRSWREILRMILAAGDGLQAAHAAGLIHRDFKPDNVMVGDDGRARVMDFGLARADQAAGVGDARASDRAVSDALTQAGALMGTPRYMAPEQWEGAATDGRTDQFALCVTLWEALYGAPPFAGDTFVELSYAVLYSKRRPPPPNAKVPAWLRRVIERGLRCAPGERWPSMVELLAALRDDPTARRRWRVAGAVAILGVGAALVGARVEREREVAACDARAAAIDETWNDGARAAIRAGIVGTGVPFVARAFETSAAMLDDFAAEWRDSERARCLATRVEETVSAELGERQEACLDERRAEIAALVDGLRRPEPGTVASVTNVFSEVRRPATCLEVERLGPTVVMDEAERAQAQEIRRTFARVKALTRMARLEDARALADEVLRAADALGVPEHRARARALACDISLAAGDFARARGEAEEALLIAGRGHADEVAAAAATDLALIVGLRFGRRDEGLAWSRLGEMWLDRLGVGDDLLRARALFVRGTIGLEAGDLDQAEADYRRALAIRERLSGPESIATVNAHEGLGNILHARGDLDGAVAVFSRALAINEAVLGPDHPDVGVTLSNRLIVALDRGALPAAIADGRRALAIAEASTGADHLHTAAIHNNLGRALAAAGELDEAARHFQRTIEINEQNLGVDHHEVAFGLNGLGDVALRRGDPSTARALHGRALALREASLGADHPYVAYSLTGLAEAMVCAGDHAEATPLLERALAIGHALDAREIVERASQALADALAASSGDPARITALRAAAGGVGTACPAAPAPG